MTRPGRTLVVVSHTHWDREWYLPFEAFRARLVREGRLVIGPGYVLPDEFLIGGESHIRNLMTGIRSGRAYGKPMMVGYAPDAFGHIAHLPAILRGFGIDS